MMRHPSRGRARRRVLASLLVCSLVASAAQARAQGGVAPADRRAPGTGVVGDSIPQALSGAPGDTLRGRSIVADRSVGLCLLCHTAPIVEERFQGDIGPDLGDVGARFSEGQLRLRLVNPRQINPQSVMPAFHDATDRIRVGSPWQGKPVLDAQQIEDVVAYLRTLRRPPP